ncbi:MAG TPA: TIGR00730 family Rossman fold protein [Chloroflexia bacterium]|nr:TIGR00730 family Rossman fold protein [Chloroflexia bacterium]
MSTGDAGKRPARALCVYCASSDRIAPGYFAAAAELGAAMATRGYALVYGGAQVGLMGAVARAVHAHGGYVIGVLPGLFQTKELAYELADELIITRDLRERKAIMEAHADGFIGLPGGFGTLEEILEILTLKQIGLTAKPVVLLNTAGFYAPLDVLFEHIYEQQFAPTTSRELYHLADDVPGAFAYLDSSPPPLPAGSEG